MNSIDSSDSKLGPLLQPIVEAKRREVIERRARLSLAEVQSRATDASPARDFFSAVVRSGQIRLIAEVKKASPSRGVIRPDFDPVTIAKSYVAGGAAALSVLTDEPFFQGSTAIFEAVRAAVDLPMIRKDFMIDPYQFYEARAMGADAVLLITSILTDAQLSEFHALARSMGMTVLVETHSEEDIHRALATLQPQLLGVNNRDLHHGAFRTDIEHTARMLPIIRALAPSGVVPSIVSESGIHTPADVARLRELGVSTVLVGESLMRQPDPGEAARVLMAQAG